MIRSCASCQKNVYPVEMLSVLEKHWHKGCFKCATCSVTLTLRSYKGYNKQPYCQSHYPTTKFTAVRDTPEYLRLQRVNKNVSQVDYHKEFNESKGAKTNVCDDPETLRAKRNQEIISNVKYHGKDRTNPSSTPLDRPSYSTPDEGEAGGPPDQDLSPPPGQEVLPPERVPSPEPMPEPEPTPEVDIAPPTPEPMSPEPAPNSNKDEEELNNAEEPPNPAPAPEESSEAAAMYVAIYDYAAADDDEIDIVEGDIVTDAEIIAEGWMTGTNSRTGEHGLLPSNYVESVAST